MTYIKIIILSAFSFAALEIPEYIESPIDPATVNVEEWGLEDLNEGNIIFLEGGVEDVEPLGDILDENLSDILHPGTNTPNSSYGSDFSSVLAHESDESDVIQFPGYNSPIEQPPTSPAFLDLTIDDDFELTGLLSSENIGTGEDALSSFSSLSNESGDEFPGFNTPTGNHNESLLFSSLANIGEILGSLNLPNCEDS